MTETPGPPDAAAGTAHQPKTPVRWRQVIAAIICAGVLLWYGIALYQRLTWAWYWTDSIQGFVAYGAHKDKFSPDATQIAVAHGNNCKVLDLASGKELSRLEQYNGQGLSASSSDGKIVSCFPDEKNGGRQACLWNAADGRLLGRLDLPDAVHGDRCYPIFSVDNKRIIAACADGLVIWDSLNLKYVSRIKIAWPSDSWLPGLLSWNPATQELTVVDADGKLLKIDRHQSTAKPLFAGQERAVKAAKWSPDGTRLVTIDREDGTVAVWDAQTGKVIASVPEKEVLYASFSPDGKRVITGKKRADVVRTGRPAPRFWDRLTRIWDATSGQLIQELATTGIVTFSPDWSFWAETGPEGLRITSADGSESCYFPEWFDGHGSSCVFAQDNTYLASVNGSGRVAIWRHRAPAHSWTECVIAHEFWISVFALTGLAWALSGLRTTRDLPT